jgi:hypothetical protein
MNRRAKKIKQAARRRNRIDPWKISLGRGFFILNAVLWISYGIYTYYDMAVKNHNTNSADLLTFYLFINAGLLFFSGIKLGKPQKWTYYFVIAVLVFNSVLSALNIVEIFFLISLLVDLFLVWVVVQLYRQYFPKP